MKFLYFFYQCFRLIHRLRSKKKYLSLLPFLDLQDSIRKKNIPSVVKYVYTVCTLYTGYMFVFFSNFVWVPLIDIPTCVLGFLVFLIIFLGLFCRRKVGDDRHRVTSIRTLPAGRSRFRTVRQEKNKRSKSESYVFCSVCVLCCLLGTVLRSHVLFGIPPLEKRGPAPLLFPTPLHAPCLNKCAITGSSGELRMSGWAMGERHEVRPSSTNSRSLSTDYCREFLVNFPNHQDSAQKELENVAADDDHHVPAGSVPSVKSLHS